AHLDAVDVGAEQMEDRGLVPRAGADLQNPVPGPDLQGLGHQCHHEWLADGLRLADGQGLVGRGGFPEPRWHEVGPAKQGHPRQPPPVADALSSQGEDEPGVFHGHGPSYAQPSALATPLAPGPAAPPSAPRALSREGDVPGVSGEGRPRRWTGPPPTPPRRAPDPGPDWPRSAWGARSAGSPGTHPALAVPDPSRR